MGCIWTNRTRWLLHLGGFPPYMRSIQYLFCRRYLVVIFICLFLLSNLPILYILKFIFVNHPLHTKVEETVQKTLTILKLEREACGDHHPVSPITNPQLSIKNLKCIFMYFIIQIFRPLPKWAYEDDYVVVLVSAKHFLWLSNYLGFDFNSFRGNLCSLTGQWQKNTPSCILCQWPFLTNKSGEQWGKYYRMHDTCTSYIVLDIACTKVWRLRYD